MDLWFYITLIVAFSLVYYGYDKKKSYELKGKELELEQKKLDVEMKRLEIAAKGEEQDKHV